MPPARLFRRFAPLLFSTLCAAPAFALSDTYSGELTPTGGGSPIPIVVEMRESGTFLTGSVTTSDPVKGSAAIEFGRSMGGHCSFSVTLRPVGLLRLSGACDRSEFWGNYTLRDAQGSIVSIGRFDLGRNKPAEAQGSGTRSTADPTTTAAACMSANTRCLIACPRGDPSVEFLCSNRCRSRLQACKGQAGGEAAAIE